MSAQLLEATASGLDQLALERLRANRRSGFDHHYRRRYGYSMPSPGRYYWQWFWDSCFHAIALSRLDADMARQELRDLVAMQRKDGFIGHINYWGRRGALLSLLYFQGRPRDWRRRHSAMIQPPLLAQAVESVYRRTGDMAFVEEMLPRVKAYYGWLARERDPDGENLIGIISPFESGMDNSPAYDEPLGIRNPSRRRALWASRALDFYNLLVGGFNYRRLARRDRFIVIDPMVNAIYADGLRSLARLQQAAGQVGEAAATDESASCVEQALNEKCWDEERGHFVYLWGRERRPITLLTAASLFPIILSSTPRQRVERVVTQHLTNEREFWLPLPVPTVAACEPSFDPEGELLIWRGPVCMNLNWFLIRGLRLHGYRAEADHIAYRSREAAERSGFREFYSPVSGRGMRGTNFGWATIVVDMDSPAI